MLSEKEKVRFIRKTLKKLYPHPKPPLRYHSHFTLLVAVLLSANSTDKAVNRVTPELFRVARTPEAMKALGQEAIREIIRPCGLSPQKSRALAGLAEIILTKHNGKVPRTFEELEALPGVGHKTASVMMVQGFGIPAFPVDTHIHRLAKRWGISSGKNVVTTENDIKRLFAEKEWGDLHLQMIYFGREYCKARGHVPADCPICSKCADPDEV